MAEVKVKPREDVKIYGTGKSKFLPAGKEVVVHRIVAEKLINLGRATKDAPKEDKKGK